ncbi:hypothetical protein ACOBR2_02725 [Telmatobacter bradus]|uniref:hypothetical protein n=1 Tax=Telmatobacter bradus TaxID=474953 RepID=UPI003B43448C
MHTVTLRILSILAALASPALLVAQSASFQLVFHGQKAGSASYRISPTQSGFDSKTMIRVSTPGIDYALSKTEQLTPARQLVHADLNAVVNQQAVHVIAATEDATLHLKVSAGGRTTSTDLVSYPQAVLLPDFDPGALENLLQLAAAHNNRDLWAILPKQAGSLEAVQLATCSDESGTLEGRTIAVHHLIATIAGAKADLFSGPENQLLQAELPQQGFALVRTGFVLTPPAKPIVPPSTDEGASSTPQP